MFLRVTEYGSEDIHRIVCCVIVRFIHTLGMNVLCQLVFIFSLRILIPMSVLSASVCIQDTESVLKSIRPYRSARIILLYLINILKHFILNMHFLLYL